MSEFKLCGTYSCHCRWSLYQYGDKAVKRGHLKSLSIPPIDNYS